MCTSPQIIIIKNTRSQFERIEYKRTRYRNGLPTDKEYIYVYQKEFSIPEQEMRDAVERSEQMRIQNVFNDYPFLTDVIEDAIIHDRIDTKHCPKAMLPMLLYKPVVLKHTKYSGCVAMMVKCGKCEECVKEYTRKTAWLIDADMRCTSNLACFMVTLTYNPENLPTDTDVSKLDPLDTNIVYSYEYGNLIPKPATAQLPRGFSHCDSGFLSRLDLTNFLKKLRITLERWYDVKVVKVAYCGEYGKKTCRPHYHLVFWFSHTNKSQFGYQVSRKTHWRGKRSYFVDLINRYHVVPRLSETYMKQLIFHLWDKCNFLALDVEIARSAQAISRYFTKYIMKYKAKDLPEELKNQYAPYAVPMFFRCSCHLGRNWADRFYDSDEAKNGYCTCYCHNKETGQPFSYRVSIPSMLLSYIDQVRKEHNPLVYDEETKEYKVKEIYPDMRPIRRKAQLIAQYQQFNLNTTPDNMPPLHEYLKRTGQTLDEMVMNDPHAVILYRNTQYSNQPKISTLVKITNDNDERRNL